MPSPGVTSKLSAEATNQQLPGKAKTSTLLPIIPMTLTATELTVGGVAEIGGTFPEGNGLAQLM